jgi:hypothetical protein
MIDSSQHQDSPHQLGRGCVHFHTLTALSGEHETCWTDPSDGYVRLILVDFAALHTARCSAVTPMQ